MQRCYKGSIEQISEHKMDMVTDKVHHVDDLRDLRTGHDEECKQRHGIL